MDEFAEISYKQVNILLEMGENNSFFPASDLIRSLPVLPNYVEGICNLDGTIAVVIDLALFLGVDSLDKYQDMVFLLVNHRSGAFVIKIPLPNVISESISLRKLAVNDRISMKIPSARYFASNSETYLVITIDEFIDFLSNELSDVLFEFWLEVYPHWNFETLANTVPNQTFEELGSVQRSNVYSATTGKSTSNMISFQIGNNNFVIDEKHVLDIIQDELKITKLPNTESWFRGIVNYQNKSMIAIDTAKIFDIQAIDNLSIDIICKGEDGSFVINASNVKSVKTDDLNPVYTKNHNDPKFHYSNIYRDNNEDVYFQLNIIGVEESIRSKQKPSQLWTPWYQFFNRDRVYYEETERYLVGELQSLDTLSTFAGNQHLVIPHERIDLLTLRPEFKMFNGFRFVKYKDRWIPSFDLPTLYGERRANLQYGTVIKVDNHLVELRSEDAIMNYKEIKLVDEKMMQIIAPSSFDSGINNFLSTRNGYAFDLDVEKIATEVSAIKNKNGKNLTQVTEEINKEYSVEEERIDVISDKLLGIWEEDAELYLFTGSGEAETKVAYHADEISSFIYKADASGEFIPWEYESSSSLYLYVKVTNEEKEVIYQIPSESYLRAVTEDSITEDEEGVHISFDEERIPILSFNNRK